MCDIAHVLMLERVEDRDALDTWLASELEFVTVDPERQALMDALALTGG